MKNTLFSRMKPDVKINFEEALLHAPEHAIEIKNDLSQKFFLNDITLGTAFYLCSYVIGSGLDYNKICDSFEPYTP